MKKILPLLIVVLLIACIYLLFFWQPASQSHNNIFSSSKSLPQGGEFTLQSISGPVSLKDFRGKVVLIYFGYTMCPDICPTNLSMMSNAFSQMDKTELEKVQGIFISVDPQRDTMERLTEYTHYFHESIIGISGTAENLREIANRYGAAYQKVIQEGSATNYVVDHSSETYVIDPEGKLVMRLPHAAPPKEILAAIRKERI
ncbi:MAG: SCO family protein [gamma proteobacterium symbiont of Taylorina sp.]|nr:SCO family protein [gamma proteobacterium symbiont of Taylorina sp.]